MGRTREPRTLGVKCKTCGEILTDLNCVYRKHYIGAICKYCRREVSKEWHSRKPGYQRAYNIEKYYGITREEYEKKLELQLGGCAVCKQPCRSGRELAVDHDHKTNTNRDLLCQRCNSTLGMVEDNEELLFALIEYLKRHSRASLKIVS